MLACFVLRDREQPLRRRMTNSRAVGASIRRDQTFKPIINVLREQLRACAQSLDNALPEHSAAVSLPVWEVILVMTNLRGGANRIEALRLPAGAFLSR
jgi:hypothetical protein